MSHEFETGFFVKDPAWHRLGTVVNKCDTTGEAISLSGLDWRVDQRDIFLPNTNSQMVKVEGFKANVRSTDDKQLGVVSEQYKPLQNRPAFEWFDPFLESKVAKLDAAGSLREGRRVFILAEALGVEGEVGKGDRVKAYLLLSNAHDGTQAVRIQFTPIRVVCMNTLGMATHRADRGLDKCVSIRHAGNMQANMLAVQQAVDVTQRSFSICLEQYRAIQKARLPVDGLKDYVKAVLDPNDERLDMPRAYEKIQEVYWRGPGADLPGVEGTYWGAYNAMTYWIDNHRGKRDESRRLDAGWFGEGKLIRERALKVALDAVAA